METNPLTTRPARLATISSSSSSSSGVVRELLLLALKMSAIQIAPLSAAIYLATCMANLGPVQLSAYSLVSSTNFMVFLATMNSLQSLYYVGGKAIGEGQRVDYERAISAGVALALRLAVLGCLISAGIGFALDLLGFDPHVVRIATGVGLVGAIGIPPALVLVVYRVHAALNGRAGFITLITTGGAGIVCAVATVIVLWLAKKPDLAVVGVVAADVSTTWLMLAAAAISVRRLPELRFSTRLRKLLTVVHRPTMRVVVSLGWPVGAVVLLDSLASLVGQFLVGRFWLEALPVHAIVAMCTSVGIVIPVGISLACVQHVAVLEAQRDWVGRNRVAAASIGLALLYGLVVMAAFCTMPQSLGAAVLGSAFDAPRRALYDQLMVPGGIVLAFQSEIIIVAALYRGIGDTRTPLLVALVGYLIVAGGAQVLLAFGLGHGAPGIWWGLVIGFGAIACVATLGIYQRLKLPPEMRQTSARASHGEAALTHGLLAREDAQVTGPVTR